ncbi:MAG: hypothetical protein A2X99_05745 [Deltaproteobacteria bacterium GWB2_55_19]|nr:MAG: hypothetical protein A2X99_05745 [Deltaproteobacteria bacterium GWB2_55_19]
MARLASREKMGFYPTPMDTLRFISDFLRLPTKSGYGDRFNLLDPCCGEGDALHYLYGMLQIYNKYNVVYAYGVELDVERATAAAGKLNSVSQGSIFDARINPLGSAGLLYLNPPYDYTEGERDEMLFLKHSVKWLCPDGVLVFVVPEALFDDDGVRKWISEHFYDCLAVRVLKNDYPAFRQAILYARKRPERVDAPISFSGPPYVHIEDIEDADIPVYEIPETREITAFQCGSAITREDILKFQPELEARLDSLFRKKRLNSRLSPLFPLRKGHLVSLITAGALNGRIRDDSEDIIIKGYSDRVEYTRQEDEREITTHTYQVGIRVIDLKARKWYDVV